MSGGKGAGRNPEGWSTASLGEIETRGLVKLGRGKIISKRDIANNPGDYPIYSSAGQNGGEFGRYGSFLFDEELITWSVDGGGHLFYRERHRFSVTNVGGWLRILDFNSFGYKYLYFALTYLHSNITFDWSRKAHPSVIRLAYDSIPIPPLAEQVKIVEILEEQLSRIDAALASVRAVREKAARFRRSLLHAAFTGTLTGHDTSTGKLPDGWVIEELRELVGVLDSMRKPINSKERLDRTGSVPYYGATGQVGTIDKALFDEDLVLLGEDGVQFFDVDKQKAYEISGPSWVNNHAHVLRCRKEKYKQHLLVCYLNQFDYRNYANGTTRLKLTQAAMNRIPVVVPPLKEQEEIVGILDEQLSRLDAALAVGVEIEKKASALRRSLLHAAFTGELTKEWREGAHV